MRKTKPSHRILAVFLTLNFLTTLVPLNLLYASNNGPNAPEAASFEPVDATDMVNLATGDFSYVLPLLDMDGFPVTMSYHAGIPMDMESSWVGLGWNLNTGAINRSVSGTPDDWKDGNSLDFIFYQDSQEMYSINVGVGFGEAAGVGVGLSWGSNKSLSGSVYASIAYASASIDTDGNYSVGLNTLGKDSNYGGSLSVSGNVNGGGPNVGVGAVGRSNSGGFASLGYNFGSNSFSIGAGFNKSEHDKGLAGGGSLSMSNFTAGDFDVSSKGFYIPISLGIFNFGFGYRKITYKLDKAYPKKGFGMLYSSDAIENAPDSPDDTFEDLQHQYYYGDAYEEAIPAFEEDFVADYKSNREKVNFSFASYDAYEVNPPGVSGMMQPRFLQNAVLMGIGYHGVDSDNSDLKMDVYYHHSNGDNTTKTFGTAIDGNSDDIKFYFNGQFTENFGIKNRGLTYNNGVNDFGDMLALVNDNNFDYQNNITERQRAGNYVEVFTNDQLRNGDLFGLMYPEGIGKYAYGNYDPNGIGAYKITAPDGKTYHYSLPVHHYERIERNILKDNSENHVSEKRQYTAYATHWLLTAVTGPDFVDKNGNNQPDSDDYGYWVRLDHGMWSDGFVWRSPYQGKDYNTNLVGDIGEKDFGNYQLGRKQIYYLDKIVTKNKTAYFVKDVRYDATAAYGANNGKDVSDTSGYQYVFNGPAIENVVEGGNVQVADNVAYPRSYQLRLDHIVVVNNGDADFSKVSESDVDLDQDGCLPGYSKVAYANPYVNSGFDPEFGSSNYQVFNEDKIYDVVDFADFDYGKAARVIQLQQNYNLAKGSPSSIYCPSNLFAGKLTLNSVQFRGKNNTEYMPPYFFSYKNEMDYPDIPPRNKAQDQLTMDYAKDPWGFIDEKFMAELHNSGDYDRYGPDNWSLTQIKTPLGSTINVEHEEDDYYMEAFSRKYWQDNLQFAFKRENCQLNNPPCHVFIYVRNMDGLRDDLKVDFGKYFSVGKKVFLDVWGCRLEDKQKFGDGGGDYRGNVDIPSNYPNDVIVHSITQDSTLILKVEHDPFQQIVYNVGGPQNLHSMVDPSDQFQNGIYRYFDKSGKGSSKGYVDIPRNSCPGNTQYDESIHTLKYKLLANKIDKELTGGGLRVKSITLEDGVGNQYRTAYYYNKPGTNPNPGNADYISSGITSFAPERGLKFIPFQSELPSPGVMYEHVTMEPFGVDGNSMGKTQYEFFTLQPLFDIFDPNLEMKDTNGIPIFESEVYDYGNGDVWIPNSDIKAYAKRVDLKVNTSHIGQFKSVSRYNSFGHLMSKTTNNYVSGEAVKAIDGRGSVRESFQTMKSVFNSIGNLNGLKKRLISISSKEEFSSVLQSVHTVSNGFETTEAYFDADPNTGAFRTTETTKADGTKIRTSKLPAYSQYPPMGSKVDLPHYTNMLTQSAMTVTEIQNDNDEWEKIGANITTWKPQIYDVTYYVGEFPNEIQFNVDYDIWRKHKTFTWNGETDPKGYFANYIGDDDGFDWSEPDAEQPKQWKQLSEITRYNNYSSPLEVMDINGNLAATKMGYNDSKTIAVCNAGYTESFYSGAEDDDGQGNFGGGVDKGSAADTPDAHTGNHALSIANGQNGFNVTVSHNQSTKRYKISLWAKSNNHENVRVNVNGENISFHPGEKVVAGDWVQLNFYSNIQSNKQVYVTSVGGHVIVDDFRLHPISSTMTSYVYNQWDELTHILGPNNMTTKYEYDEAGRLLRIYSEVINVDQVLTGGFKKVKEYAYDYKDYVLEEENGEALFLNLGVEHFNVNNTNVIANAIGGSGQYEYQWSVKNCQDPEQGPVWNECPGDLQPTYGNWTPQNTVPISSFCNGLRAVYWCRVRDVVTQNIVEASGNHLRGDCENNGGQLEDPEP